MITANPSPPCHPCRSMGEGENPHALFCFKRDHLGNLKIRPFCTASPPCPIPSQTGLVSKFPSCSPPDGWSLLLVVGLGLFFSSSFPSFSSSFPLPRKTEGGEQRGACCSTPRLRRHQGIKYDGEGCPGDPFYQPPPFQAEEGLRRAVLVQQLLALVSPQNQKNPQTFRKAVGDPLWTHPGAMIRGARPTPA